MRLYRVEELALFYCPTVAGDVKPKSFTAVYRLEEGKTFQLTVRENEDSNHLILKTIPTHVLLQPSIFEILTVDEPTQISCNVQFCFVQVTKL